MARSRRIDRGRAAPAADPQAGRVGASLEYDQDVTTRLQRRETERIT